VTTWDEYNGRRAAIRAVLDFATANPAAGLPFDELPGVAANFADRRELLLALQYEWSQALWTHIELLTLDVPLTDASELAQTAWAQCAAQHPALRALLDAARDELGPSSFRDQELMSASFVA
jgi:hypothetical protein